MTALQRIGPDRGCRRERVYVGPNEADVAVGNDEWLLVAEDDASARDALAEILRDEGFRVRTAADGAAALGVLAARPIEIVITDLQMPHMDGLQLLQQMRERGVNAPTIMMSAHATEAAAQQASDLGALGFLHKPVDVQALMELVQQALAGLARSG